MYKEVLNNIR